MRRSLPRSRCPTERIIVYRGLSWIGEDLRAGPGGFPVSPPASEISAKMLEPLGKNHGIDPKRRADITIFYGEPQSGLSSILRTTMRREGFLDVRLFASFGPMVQAFKECAPDVVLFDGNMPDGDACTLIKDLREGRLGSNPFVPTIVTSWQPTESLVRSIIDSGSDDLMVKPNSPDRLLTRVGALAQRRKPFVVTSDYIGPDHHPDEIPGAPRIIVPNTLRAKAMGETLDQSAIRRVISGALRQVNEGRLRQHAIAVAQLVGSVVPAYRNGRAGTETLAQAERLLAVSRDAVYRLRGTSFEPVADLCAALQSVTETVLRAHPAPGRKELDLLPRLAEAIVISFGSGKADAEVAGEISSSVGRFLQERVSAA